jgi:hypothetical protein
MMLSVRKTENSEWVVTDLNSVVAGPFKTNSEAWRAMDRITGDVVSKSESTSQWLWNKAVHNE